MKEAIYRILVDVSEIGHIRAAGRHNWADSVAGAAHLAERRSQQQFSAAASGQQPPLPPPTDPAPPVPGRQKPFPPLPALDAADPTGAAEGPAAAPAEEAAASGAVAAAAAATAKATQLPRLGAVAKVARSVSVSKRGLWRVWS